MTACCRATFHAAGEVHDDTTNNWQRYRDVPGSSCICMSLCVYRHTNSEIADVPVFLVIVSPARCNDVTVKNWYQYCLMRKRLSPMLLEICIALFVGHVPIYQSGIIVWKVISSGQYQMLVTLSSRENFGVLCHDAFLPLGMTLFTASIELTLLWSQWISD